MNLVHTTIWGDALPGLASRSEWVQLAPDRVPPTDVGYREWLCCATSKWECLITQCFPRDPYEGIRRWAPRRNHAAVGMNRMIYVLGGRARALEDIPESEANGGILGARTRWREPSTLRNDVWSSPDGCESLPLVASSHD